MEEHYLTLKQLKADLEDVIDGISEELEKNGRENYAIIANLDDALSGLDAAMMIYPRRGNR